MAWYEPDLSDYALKYNWRSTDAHGVPIGLNIYVKLETGESAPTAMTIGGILGLRLQIQGGQDGVFAPFVKTSLELNLVDAPEKSTTTVKCGGWEEFFTPDSTKYLVELLKGSSIDSSADTVYWRGYITPDSWQESLDYHGAISIVARDNIGHLQDFEFDPWGNESIDLGFSLFLRTLESALISIAFPMSVSIPYENSSSNDAKHLLDSNGYLIDAGYFSEQFDGDSLLDVCESILESTGYVFRFFGDATCCLLPIRNLPLRQETRRSTASAKSLQIEFYGGTRSLDPAYNQISDVVKYEGDKKLEQDLSWRFKVGNHIETYTGRFYDTEDRAWKTFTGRSIRQNNYNGSREGWSYGMGYWNGEIGTLQDTLLNEDGENALKDCIMLAADMQTGIDRSYMMRCFSTDVVLKFDFDKPVELKSAPPYIFARLKSYLYQVVMAVEYHTLSGSVYRWDGATWVMNGTGYQTINVATEMSESYSFEVILQDIFSQISNILPGGYLVVIFNNIINRGDDTPDYGSFARLNGITVEQRVAKRVKSDKVTTINNSSYNVRVERKPDIAALSLSVPYFSLRSYENIIWTYDTNDVVVPFKYNTFWDGESSSDAIPLAGQIHKQMLCFNHEALSILEGSFGPVNKDYAVGPEWEFVYKNKRFILQSGTLDIITGRMESASLREFIWWDDLWDETQQVTLARTAALSASAEEDDESEEDTTTAELTSRLTAVGISQEKVARLLAGESVTLTDAQSAEVASIVSEADENATVSTISVTKEYVASSASFLAAESET